MGKNIENKTSAKNTDFSIKELCDNELFNGYLELMLREFKFFIKFHSVEKSFASFKDNKFFNEQEGYKKVIYESAKLWLKEMRKIKNFGSGELLRKLIECIELPNNNLVEWREKHGPNSKVHAKLFELFNSNKKNLLKEFEENTWNFYFSENCPERYYFDYFTDKINHKYSLIAYLYFIKDRSKYLPIATETFDSFFKDAGLDFKTSKKCSWENYCGYITIVDYVKYFLIENFKKLQYQVAIFFNF